MTSERAGRFHDFTVDEAIEIGRRNDPGENVPSTSRTLIAEIERLRSIIESQAGAGEAVEYFPSEIADWLDARGLLPSSIESEFIDISDVIELLNTHESELLAQIPQPPEIADATGRINIAMVNRFAIANGIDRNALYRLVSQCIYTTPQPAPVDAAVLMDKETVRRVAKAIVAARSGHPESYVWKQLGSNERKFADEVARSAIAALAAQQQETQG